MQRRMEREGLIDAIESFLDGFEQAGRQPDLWESIYLLRAVENLIENFLTVARKDLAYAETPHELRPPAEFKKLPKNYAAMTVAELRECVTQAKAKRVWQSTQVISVE